MGELSRTTSVPASCHPTGYEPSVPARRRQAPPSSGYRQSAFSQRAAMAEPPQDLEPLLDDVVRRRAAQIRYETEAAHRSTNSGAG